MPYPEIQLTSFDNVLELQFLIPCRDYQTQLL